MIPKRVKLPKSQLRKAEISDLNVGVHYYTLHDQKRNGVTWTKWDYRGRLIQGSKVDNTYIHKGETEEEYKEGYVRQIQALVKLGLIFVKK